MQNLIIVDANSSCETKAMATSLFLSHNQDLKLLYPNFEKWITDKVVPGLEQGSRKFIVSINEKKNISGYAIVKDESDEKKLCCLRVLSPYQNRYGIGDRLFKNPLSC